MDIDLVENLYKVIDYIVPLDLVNYDSIFLVGESAAGKTTTMNIIKGKGFIEKYEETPIAESHNSFPIFCKGIKLIKIIDTPGGNLPNLAKWKEKNYTIRCIIFDTTKLQKNIKSSKDKKDMKRVKNGIKNTVKEVDAINGEYIDKKFKFIHRMHNFLFCKKEKVVKCVAIGTRGDEVDSEDREEIKKEVIKMGIPCKIFELKNNPKKELIKFIFQGE